MFYALFSPFLYLVFFTQNQRGAFLLTRNWRRAQVFPYLAARPQVLAIPLF
jgi:hypothetical protein